MVKNKVKASDSFYKKKVRLDVITRLLKTIRLLIPLVLVLAHFR